MMNQGNTIEPQTERPLIPLREAHEQLTFAFKGAVLSSRVIPTKKQDSHMMVASILSDGKVYNLSAFRVDPDNNPFKLVPDWVYVFDRVKATYRTGSTLDLILESPTRSKCTPIAKMNDPRFNGAYSLAKLQYSGVESLADLREEERLNGQHFKGIVSGIGITRTIKAGTDQEKQIASIEIASFDGTTCIDVVRFYQEGADDLGLSSNPLRTAVIGMCVFIVGASVSKKQIMINDSTRVILRQNPDMVLPEGVVPRNVSHPVAGTFIDDQTFIAQKITSLYDIVRIKSLVLPDSKGKFTLYVGINNVTVRDIGLPFADYCSDCRKVVKLGDDGHSECQNVSYSVEFTISDGTTTIDIKGGRYLNLDNTEWAGFDALNEELRSDGGLVSVRDKLKAQDFCARICLNHYPAKNDEETGFSKGGRTYLSLSSLNPAGPKAERRVVPKTMETCD